MHFLTNVCFMCLRRTQKMLTVSEDNGILQQFKFVYPEVVHGDTELPRSVCSICYIAVNSFYSLKKRSMKAYHRWLGYVRLLQGNYPKHKFGEIQIRIYKSNSNDEEIEDEEEGNNNEERRNRVDKNQEKLFISDDENEDRLVIDEGRKHKKKKIKITKLHPLDLTNVVQKQLNVTSHPIQNEERGQNNKNSVKTNENSSNEVTVEEYIHCPVCQKPLKNKHLFIHHFVSKHAKGKQNITCPFCAKICTKTYMRQHFRMHFSLNIHTCQICKKQIFKKSSLDAHMKSAHKEVRSIRCYQCNEDFEAQDLYCLHVKSQKHRIRCEELSKSNNMNDRPITETQQANKNSLVNVDTEISKENVDNSVIKEQNVPMEVV